MAGAVNAATVAIVKGSFYTQDLKNQLEAKGNTVTEITSYNAAALAAFDSVFHYGNSFTDTVELTNYVFSGGNLVLLPWSGHNFSVPTNIQIFDETGNSPVYSRSNPGMTALDASSELLAGVTLPGAGAPQIGRVTGANFVGGVNQVAAYTDGTDLLGWKSYGDGTVVGLNLHLITSDTAYTVVNTPWGMTLADNAANFSVAAVPLPATLPLLLAAIGGMGWVSRRRKATT